ncbi:hypothetical protein F5Y05DRAFT_406536 [Hypoxylon sp. FL0543]|nr:hypothetical protein F5Y05DRAFT_406536 [Hypoxylon sp. FL0543]
MSYQYPPPQEDPELGVSQVGYIGGSHLTATSCTPEDNQIPLARRRESLSQAFKLKRSVSTPNVRPQGPNEADPGPLGLPNEKRRNKLGYHRTPMACVHCRKRKIRCKQPEIPDVLRRCESCINLKKDCAYTAVNQSPPLATGQRQGSRASVGTSLASPSTSPAMPTGHTVEKQSNPPYHHQLATMPSMPSMSQQPIEPSEDEAYPSETKVPPNATSGREFNYGHGASGWISAEATPSAVKTPGDTSAPWTSFSHGMPETPDVSYTPHAPVSLSAWPATPLGLSRIDTNTRLDDEWKPNPPGTRSMSYSDEQSGHFASTPTRSYERVHVPEAHLSAQGSLSAGAVPYQTYNAWQQSYQYVKPEDSYEEWYAGHEHYPSDAHFSSAGEDPSQAGGMYYGGR